MGGYYYIIIVFLRIFVSGRHETKELSRDGNRRKQLKIKDDSIIFNKAIFHREFYSKI